MLIYLFYPNYILKKVKLVIEKTTVNKITNMGKSLRINPHNENIKESRKLILTSPLQIPTVGIRLQVSLQSLDERKKVQIAREKSVLGRSISALEKSVAHIWQVSYSPGVFESTEICERRAQAHPRAARLFSIVARVPAWCNKIIENAEELSFLQLGATLRTTRFLLFRSPPADIELGAYTVPIHYEL